MIYNLVSTVEYSDRTIIDCFDLLIKEKTVPRNYNLWLLEKFTTGCIKCGNIEKQIEDIAPGFCKYYEQSLSG